MKRFGLLLFAWCLLVSLLAARSEAAAVCPEAKYRPMSLAQGDAAKSEVGGGGIGGTGRSAGESGGIGGTGIVGTITGFASICVNGLEVHYDRDVPVSDNGRRADSRQLAIGQLVVVEAVDSARGLEARNVGIVHVLEGPVTNSAKAGGLEIMGVPVVTSDLVGQQSAPPLRKGDWVQVSGHPDAQGRVFASRIVQIPPRPEATVVGEAQPASRRVGAVMTDQRQVGEVIARGRWDGYRLRVREVQPAPNREWRTPPDRIVIEARVLEVENGRVQSDRAEVDALLGEQGGNLKPGDIVRVTARRDAEKGLRTEKLDRAERAPRAERGKRETVAGPEKAGKADKVDKAAAGNRREPAERHNRNDRGAREDRSARAERQEQKPERSVPRERPDRNRRDR
jgi:hypothetical protein